MTSPASLSFERLGATFMLLWVSVVYYALAQASFQFGEILEVFEELPWTTRLLLHTATYWTVPVVAAISYVSYWFGVSYSRTVQAACALSTFAAVPAFVIGVYLPFFELGQRVGQ